MDHAVFGPYMAWHRPLLRVKLGQVAKGLLNEEWACLFFPTQSPMCFRASRSAGLVSGSVRRPPVCFYKLAICQRCPYLWHEAVTSGPLGHQCWKHGRGIWGRALWLVSELFSCFFFLLVLHKKNSQRGRKRDLCRQCNISGNCLRGPTLPASYLKRFDRWGHCAADRWLVGSEGSPGVTRLNLASSGQVSAFP